MIRRMLRDLELDAHGTMITGVTCTLRFLLHASRLISIEIGQQWKAVGRPCETCNANAMPHLAFFTCDSCEPSYATAILHVFKQCICYQTTPLKSELQ